MVLGFGVLVGKTLKARLALNEESQRMEGENKQPHQESQSIRPIVIPSIRSSLRRGEQIAVAIEARGYGYDIAHRTFRRELKLSRTDALTMMILTGIMIVGLVVGQWELRMAMWTYTSNLLRSIIR